MGLCLGQHATCQQYRNIPRVKPERILYFELDQDETVKLIKTKDLKDSGFSYATLSHRWGSPGPPKLSEDESSEFSIQRLEAGIPSRELPQAFRDAIEIVKYCGIRYMWIDCLCIIQDRAKDGRNVDWEGEVGKMSDIYAGGIL